MNGSSRRFVRLTVGCGAVGASLKLWEVVHVRDGATSVALSSIGDVCVIAAIVFLALVIAAKHRAV